MLWTKYLLNALKNPIVLSAPLGLRSHPDCIRTRAIGGIRNTYDGCFKSSGRHPKRKDRVLIELNAVFAGRTTSSR